MRSAATTACGDRGRDIPLSDAASRCDSGEISAGATASGLAELPQNSFAFPRNQCGAGTCVMLALRGERCICSSHFGTAYMLPRCSAALLLVLVFIFGIINADRRLSSVPGEAGSAPPLAATAHLDAQVLVSAQVDDQEVRQSSPPAVAQPRSASGEPGKWFLIARQPDWRCLAQACFKLADAFVADIPQHHSTTRFATGPPATAA